MAQGRIEIIYTAQEQFESGNTAIDQSTGQTQKVSDITRKKSEALAKARQAFYTSAFQRVKSTSISLVKGEVEYWINRSYKLADDVQGARNLKLAVNAVSQIWRIGESTVSGAVAGGAFGPVGAIVGGAIGFVSSSVGTITNSVHGVIEQETTIATQNAQLSFNRFRAGYSLTSGDKGENR